MLVFSEGVPRSGKSYDAVKNHILPALKSGRHVYARLNGLNGEKIAEHLKMPLQSVQELLHVVSTGEVVELFKAYQADVPGADEKIAALVATGDYSFAMAKAQVYKDSQWTIDSKFKNALIVIDEVHEFYVGGTREPLAPAAEQFFALHGHYGMDILTMTQFYKRVHTAIRFRIERKNTFQKLSALGKKGENLYRETAWQTVAPDRYEKAGAQTRTYDKAVFPLYHGIVDGGESGVEQSVYSGGRVTIWKTLLIPSLIMIPIGLAAIWYLLDFFSGGGTKLVKGTTAITQPVKVTQPQPAAGVVYQRPVGPAAPVKPEPTPREKHLEAMTPEQRYVWDLTGKGRIRFTGTATAGGRVHGWVQWFDNGSNVLDQLSLDQLRAMGVEAVVATYGVKLLASNEAIVATAWPVNRPVREESPRLYDTSGGGRHASEASLSPAPLVAARYGAHNGGGPDTALGVGDSSFRGQQSRYGQMRNSDIPDDYQGSMIR